MDYVIHTSDRMSFKGCRRRWNWISDLRMGLKPIETPQPFYFGSAAHAAFEVIYDPQTWYLVQNPETRSIIVEAAVRRFIEEIDANKARYLKLTGREGLDEEHLEKYNQDLDLGIGMIRHYVEYVWSHNMERFTPIATELSFRVPIFSKEAQMDYFPWMKPEDNVLYGGRIDLLVQDEWGEFWIWDHKTAASFKDTMSFLEMDEQLGSYNWAAQQMLGIKIAGNVYAQILKAYPKPLEPLKVTRLGRSLSTNKQFPTSYDVAFRSIVENGEEPAMYEDYLHYLKHEGLEFVRRIPVHRNQHELFEIGERIKMETIEMLNPDLFIYPHPTEFGCNYCPFRQPCVATNDGSDVEWMLSQYTTKESRTNA